MTPTPKSGRSGGGATGRLRRGPGFRAAVAGVVVLLWTGFRGFGAEDPLWTAHVEPLLKDRCLECHNATKSKSGLDVSSLQTLLRGGDRGAAVIPGRPDDSNLFKFLSAEADPHMPPGKRKPLSPEEGELIRKWIRELPAATAPRPSEAPVAQAGKAGMVANPTPARRRIAWTPSPSTRPADGVDRFLELSWKLDQVTPVKRIDDAAFVRRAYLDLIGRIPSAAEREAFVQSKGRDKRSALIDALLAHEEYPRRMREVFDPVLMTRRGPDWEEKRRSWHAFLEEAFRSNRPWDQVIRDLIVARPPAAGATPEQTGAVWYLYERQNNAQAMAESLAPVVFGVQIKCAQCHDHMVAREIKQAHYWGMVSAFNRSRNVDTPAGPGVSESAIGGFVSFANLRKESQPASLTFFNGRSVDEARPKEGEKEVDRPELYLVPPPREKEKPELPAVPKFSRRAALADAVTRENPLLARAMVNRVWAMLLGRGIVHPVDLMDSKHPPTHPELLDWLAADFASHGYDVKRLLRILCNTRAYQLESRVVGARGTKLSSPDAFARGLDKPLTAEQLFRSLLVATGQPPDARDQVPGLPATELRRAFVAQFPDLFPAEYNATLYQAMFVSNSPLFDQILAARPGTLASRLQALPDSAARVREGFLAVFGRLPDRDEQEECLRYLAGRDVAPGIRQLLWALLTSAEFQINH